MNKRSSFVIAAIAFLLFVASGTVSDYRSRWYRSLRKPSWVTFEGAIPFIWAFIYVCTTISAIITWNSMLREETRRGLLSLFAVNGVLNFLYTLIFTRRRDLLGATIDSAAIVSTIAGVMLWQWKHSRVAALLNLPYLIWGSIATYLSWFMYDRNQQRGACALFGWRLPIRLPW